MGRAECSLPYRLATNGLKLNELRFSEANACRERPALGRQRRKVADRVLYKVGTRSWGLRSIFGADPANQACVARVVTRKTRTFGRAYVVKLLLTGSASQAEAAHVL